MKKGNSRIVQTDWNKRNLYIYMYLFIYIYSGTESELKVRGGSFTVNCVQ